jgi:hypothetical protein
MVKEQRENGGIERWDRESLIESALFILWIDDAKGILDSIKNFAQSSCHWGGTG